jgi:hypothetical protein
MSEPLPVPPPQQGIAFTITGKEIWESLQRVAEGVADIKSDLHGVPDAIKDHETRLRSIEKRLWVAAGFAAAAGGGIGGALSRFLGN